MPSIEEVKACPTTLQPDIEWEREVVHQFSELRQRLEVLSSEGNRERTIVVPAMKDQRAWLLFCLGDALQEKNNSTHQVKEDESLDLESYKNRLVKSVGLVDCNDDTEEGEQTNGDAEEGDEEEEESKEEDDAVAQSYPEWQGARGLTPTVPLILQLDQVLTQRLLIFLIHYLEDNTYLSSACAAWIYALLARVEKPLHRDTVAVLRQLYRKVSLLRFQYASNLKDGMGNDSHSHSAGEDREYVARLNLLAVLTGYYFGQGEAYEHLQCNGEEGMAISNDEESTAQDSSSEEGEEEEDEEEGGADAWGKVMMGVAEEELEEGEEVE